MISKLELSDNKIAGSELKNLPAYENLKEIRLANTKIDSINDVKNLAKFKNLELLELEESPITKLENYRENIFEILPKLTYLDNITKDGQVYQNGNNYKEKQLNKFFFKIIIDLRFKN